MKIELETNNTCNWSSVRVVGILNIFSFKYNIKWTGKNGNGHGTETRIKFLFEIFKVVFWMQH